MIRETARSGNTNQNGQQLDIFTADRVIDAFQNQERKMNMTLLSYYLKKGIRVTLMKGRQMIILQLVLETELFHLTFLEVWIFIKLMGLSMKLSVENEETSQPKTNKKKLIRSRNWIKSAALIELSTRGSEMLSSKRSNPVKFKIQVFSLIFREQIY